MGHWRKYSTNSTNHVYIDMAMNNELHYLVYSYKIMTNKHSGIKRWDNGEKYSTNSNNHVYIDMAMNNELHYLEYSL